MVKIFDGYWLPWLQSVWPDPTSWHYFLFVGGNPAADTCFEAFGMLTSGLFVSIGVVLPAVFIFYLMMTILEDSGYLPPRLAVLMDSVLHRIGLHGYAIVPTILGLGCNVPAVTATRILETKKQRFIMMTLIALFIPCGGAAGYHDECAARQPDGSGDALPCYRLWHLWVCLKQGDPGGENPEILVDVPPLYHWPVKEYVAKKLWNRTKGFLKEAVPFVLFGVLVVNLLYLGGA